MKPSRLHDLALTLPKLGIANLLRIAAYRFALRTGLLRWLLPVGSSYAGPFWEGSPTRTAAVPSPLRLSVLARATRIRSGYLTWFSSEERHVGFPPEWPGASSRVPPEHWSQVPEFAAGDIKLIWEPSRFDALPILAAGLAVEPQPDGAPLQLADVEDWMSSWVRSNPANAGPNWRCAQETALRLLNTLVADRLLEAAGVRRAAALERFVAEHCARIRPTMLYAVAQDNNHATSEAAALYVGGGWLVRSQELAARRYGRVCMRAGRRAFERAIRRLVMADGSFAQHSVNYHRLLLDTACVFELFRRDFADAPLAADVRGLLEQATMWLIQFTDPISGDAPNLGANDGARLLQLGRAPYRDFRPHAQLAAALLADSNVDSSLASDATDDLLHWFGLPKSARAVPAAVSRLFPDGGYAVLIEGSIRVYVRLPVFRFRPSHADVLHVDVWWKGENVAMDSGTYSYNTDPKWMAYFPGTVSHNTVQFCGRDQMPKLSRFLFGRWPRAEQLRFSAQDQTVSCGYRDFRGARHWRQVRVDRSGVQILDISDTRETGATAVSHLRLAPGAWRIDGDGTVTDDRIRISFDHAGARVALAEGHESRHYNQMSSVAVVERTAARFPDQVSWRIEFG